MVDGALRLGILGAARITVGGIIPAAARTDMVEVTAVATRGGEKARAVHEAAPEAELFEDYASLIESAEVDAVYVPLPNSMHVEWTLKALVVVVLAGIGSVGGAFVAGLILGIVEAVGAIFMGPYAVALGLVIFLAILMFRPQGLFGKI